MIQSETNVPRHKGERPLIDFHLVHYRLFMKTYVIIK